MSRITSRLASIASLTALMLVSVLAGRASTQDGPAVPHRVMEQAAARGTVRVIVRLATPYTPEPHLRSHAHVMNQRRDISAAQTTVRGGLHGAGHRIVREFNGRLPLMAIEASPDALRMLRTMRGTVLEIHEDRRTPPSLAQTVPLLGVPTVWNAGFDGTDQIVAILDTGVQTSHPFFAAGGGKVIAEACFSSSIPQLLTTSVCPAQDVGGANVEELHGPGAAQPCAFDGCEHGTHVAGIAAGDGRGVSGAPPGGVARGARIIAIQVFSQVDDPAFDACGDIAFTPCPLSYTSDQIAALEWLDSMRLAFGTRRIASANMSLGGGREEQPCSGDPLESAIQQLRIPNATDPTDPGVLTVIAAGNDGFTDALSNPACIPDAIAVASSTKGGGTVSSFSNIGNALVFPNLVMAPGGDGSGAVVSSVPPQFGFGSFAGFIGTSMSTPHVAGAIAVLRQIEPTLDVDSVLDKLKSTGTQVPDTRGICFDCLTGGAVIPRINVLAAAAQLAPPNLVVQTLTVASSAVPGANISVSVSIRNAGVGTAAAPNSANVYLSTNSSVAPGATALVTISFPELKGGITSGVMPRTVQIPPGTAAGTYFLVAVADAGEEETNASDNSKAVPITIVLPDLMVSSVAANPTATAPGANVSVTHTIKNLGVAPASAPASISRLFLSGDPTFGGDVDLGTVAVPTIGALGTVSVSRMVQIPPATAPGLYWIFVQANTTSAFAELPGGSNVGMTATPVIVGPDLLVTAATPSPVATAPGFNVSVTTTVRNQGGQAAGAFDVAVYLSTNPTFESGSDQLLATRRVAGLGAGLSMPAIPVSAPIPAGLAAGTYFLIVRADNADEVPEASETNNTFTTVAIQVARPDLAVQSVTVPAAVAPGQNVSVTHVVRNVALAPGAASASSSRLYLSTDPALDVPGDTVLGDVPIPALGGGAMATVTRLVQIPPATPPGLYWIIAQANVTGTVQEADGPTLANNVKATTTPVIVGPDLVVTAATPTPLAAAPGATVNVSNTVKNQGGQAAGAFDVGIYLSTNATFEAGSDLLLTSRSVAGLAAGMSSGPVTTPVVLPANLSAGTYFLLVRADSAGTPGAVLEADETNNVRSTPAIQVVRPDLTVQTVTAPAAAAPGQNVSVMHVVKNIALTPGGAPASVSRLYLSADATLDVPGDTVLGDVAAPSLAGGATTTVSRVVQIPPATGPGLYWIIAQANVTGTVQEADAPTLVNNVRATSTPVIVGPDLVVTAATPSPLALAPGFNVSVMTTVKNQGGQAAVAFDVGLYLSTDATFDGVLDQRLATRRVMTGLAAGITSTLAVVGTIPANLSAGTYFLIARADDAGEVAEANATNNTRTSVAIQVVRPDLTVSSVSFAPAAIPAGTAANVSVTHVVRNLSPAPGSAVATQSRLLLSQTQSAAGALVDLGLGAVPAVAPLASVSVARTVALPPLAPGRYFFVASADDPGTLFEREENNNALGSAAALVVGPDLTVTTAATTTGAIPGANISVSYTIRNLGAPAGSFNVSFALLPVSTPGLDIAIGPSRAVVSLAAGGTLGTSSVVHIPSSLADGQYRVRVIADLEGLVAEADETNNAIPTALLTVRAPDLSIFVLGVPGVGIAGKTVTIQNTVLNNAIAPGTAPSFSLGLYLAAGAIIDPATDTLLASRTIASLAPSATSVAMTPVTLPIATGQYFIGAVADRGSTVAESNENNNQASAAITVVPAMMRSTTATVPFTLSNCTIPANNVSTTLGGSFVISSQTGSGWSGTATLVSGGQTNTIRVTGDVDVTGAVSGTFTITNSAGPRGNGTFSGTVTSAIGGPGSFSASFTGAFTVGETCSIGGSLTTP